MPASSARRRFGATLFVTDRSVANVLARVERWRNLAHSREAAHASLS
jgi:hypothetical protein